MPACHTGICYPLLVASHDYGHEPTRGAFAGEQSTTSGDVLVLVSHSLHVIPTDPTLTPYPMYEDGAK